MPWDEGLVNSLVYDAPDPREGRVLGYVAALREALDLALAADPAVFVLGQGVDDPGSMFGTTKGLHEKYGRERVFDTPLSEEAMMGTSAGAAMNGMRPVYMHNRPDFILLAMNQLVTHAAKFHFMDNGQTTVPMVVWAAIGRGWGSGAQHSQAIQGILLGVPGLKIVMPSTPFDAKGLMLAAIADNNPVLIFEHRWLMKKDGVVPEGIYKVPIGKGIYRRRGGDLTIVGASHAIELGVDRGEQACRRRHRRRCHRSQDGQAYRRRHHRRVGEEHRPPARRGYGLVHGRRLRRNRLHRRRALAGILEGAGAAHWSARHSYACRVHARAVLLP